MVGIIGKNGAGKSTLLKLISRITSPTTGTIKAKGRIGSLLEVGTGMHPEMTARENIFLNGAILGMRRHEVRRKFDDIVDFAGCAMYVDTPIKRYSSGMKVRLGFAVAAFLEPEILIVDEVLAVGDFEFQQKAIGKMKDVSRGDGRTVLLVSHNMASIRRVCERVIILDQGQILFSAPAEDAVARYLRGAGEPGASEKSWHESESPGNHNIRLLSVTVRPMVGTILDTESGARITWTFLNYRQNTLIGTTILIRNDLDILVIHEGVKVTPDRDSVIGTYQAEVEIPGSLLNAGRYTITLIFGENRQLLYSADRIVTFQMHYNSANGRPTATNALLRTHLNFRTQLVHA